MPRIGTVVCLGITQTVVSGNNGSPLVEPMTGTAHRSTDGVGQWPAVGEYKGGIEAGRNNQDGSLLYLEVDRTYRPCRQITVHPTGPRNRGSGK